MATLHPESHSFLEANKAQGTKPYHELSVPEAREASLKGALAGACEFEFNGEIKEVCVPSSTFAGTLIILTLIQYLNYGILYNG